MGLLNKLKNVLFEEEEVEETIEEPKVKPVSKNTMEFPKVTKETVKKDNYNYEEETDRELFKAEKTFDFPAFDEEEFEDFAPKKKEEPVKRYDRDIDKRRRTLDSYDKPYKKEYTSTRIVKSIKETPKKAFKPSPVISPVYGILDKNYKKEDVVTRDEIIEKKAVKLDVDSVRKKAFGSLEEDLQKTLSEPSEKFYDDLLEDNVVDITKEMEKEDSLEELDNLLDKTVDTEIDVTKEMEIPSRVEKAKYEEIEPEEVIEEDNDIELEDKEIDTKEESTEVADDTLENDLFELIDSMYEDKEGEE